MIPDIMVLNALLFVIGLVIIIKGSDFFLDAAVWIAEAAGVPQVVVGATLVSLCTTLPELVSSTTAVLKGSPDMALGNAVGSVICNTGFILGMMLLFVTAHINREVFLVKGLFMLGGLGMALVLCLPVLGQTGYVIGRGEGGGLLVVLVVYMIVNYVETLRHQGRLTEEEMPDGAPRADWMRHFGLFAIGAVMVAIGAYMLVAYGQRLARNLGVSEAVISLVFVALGTSLPELFTAISAVRKKAEHISIGNIFGANVLNTVLVTGTAAMIKPLGIVDHDLARIDLPVAITLCGSVFVIGLVGQRVGRRTGIVLLALYVGYLASMVLLGRI